MWVYGCMGMGLTLADRHDSTPEPVVLAAASLASDEDVPVVTGVSGRAPRQPAWDDHQSVVGTLQLLTEESWGPHEDREDETHVHECKRKAKDYERGLTLAERGFSRPLPAGLAHSRDSAHQLEGGVAVVGSHGAEESAPTEGDVSVLWQLQKTAVDPCTKTVHS